MEPLINQYCAIKRSKSYSYYTTKMHLRFLIAFYYTAIIFYGLTMNIEKLKFTKPSLPIYFFIIYLSGIVCLGYITNIIATSIGSR